MPSRSDDGDDPKQQSKAAPSSPGKNDAGIPSFDKRMKQAAEPMPEQTAFENNASVQVERITDQKSLISWLRTRPVEVTRIIALRIALRFFPEILQAVNVDDIYADERQKKNLIFDSFRALFLVKAFAENPLYREKIHQLNVWNLEGATSARDGGILAVKDAFAAIAGAYQVSNIAYISDVLSKKSSLDQDGTAAEAAYRYTEIAFGLAANAAAAARLSKDEMWAAIIDDVEYLEGVDDGGLRMDQDAFIKAERSLLIRPLWANNLYKDQYSSYAPPDWVLRSLNVFASGIGSELPWSLIARWYGGAVTNSNNETADALGRETELIIATQPEEFWQGDPTEVLWRIQRNDFIQFDTSSPGDPLQDNEPKQPKKTIEAKTTGDAPAHIDALGRKWFAELLCKRIIDVRKELKRNLKKNQDHLYERGRSEELRGDGFAAHLRAPWGAGKTTLLNFMEDYLVSPDRGEDRFVVVKFNAWRHQYRKPPWWPLLEAVHCDAHRCLRERRLYETADDIDAIWKFSKWGAAIGPYFIAAGALIAFFLTSQWAIEQGTDESVSDFSKNLVSLIVTGVAAFGSFAWMGRRLIFGSDHGAKQHVEISHDPLGRLSKVFKRMVRATRAPICIFIDDLDRCDATYVVELLEGIQTAFRHEDVCYVVAADREWIKSAFETYYNTFEERLRQPGQSLGYMFLEKVFQVSVALPGVSNKSKRDFISRTAGYAPETDETPETAPQDLEELDASVVREVRKIEQAFPEGPSRAQLNERVKGDDRPELRAAAAIVSERSSQSVKQQERLFENFAHAFPDIPRVMIRMINAATMRSIALYLEGELDVSDEALVRWTLLEHRFPEAADFLTRRPDYVEDIGEPAYNNVPDALKPYAGMDSLRLVIGWDGDKPADDRLTADQIRALTRGSRV